MKQIAIIFTLLTVSQLGICQTQASGAPGGQLITMIFTFLLLVTPAFIFVPVNASLAKRKGKNSWVYGFFSIFFLVNIVLFINLKSLDNKETSDT